MKIRSMGWSAAALLALALAHTGGIAFAQDADRAAMERIQAMSDSLKGAESYIFTAGVFFDEIAPTGLRAKRYAGYDVAVRHPNYLAWSVLFDDGTIRRGVFDGKTVTFAVPASKTFTRLPFEGTIDALIDHLQDEYGIGLPVADFVYSDLAAAHGPHIVTATHLGDRVLADATLSHVLVEGAAADWQIWIRNDEQALPVRFVATYVRQLGDPEYMITFWDWSLNEATDADFQLEIPDDWQEVALGGAD